METYLIETPHKSEECLRALDELAGGVRGPELLEKSYFGCGVGVHTGWAIVSEKDEIGARERLPVFLRDKARVLKVNQFTAAQIASFHGK